MFPRRGAIALITTLLALVLLFSFKTPEQVPVGAVASTGGSTVGATRPAATPAATPTEPPTTVNPQTVTGSLIATRFGNVEVQVTIAGGKITAVEAVELPTHGRSGWISSAVAPILASEAVTAQSANIDIISGATFTSDAYAQSLQAALDQAGITSALATG